MSASILFSIEERVAEYEMCPRAMDGLGIEVTANPQVSLRRTRLQLPVIGHRLAGFLEEMGSSLLEYGPRMHGKR